MAYTTGDENLFDVGINGTGYLLDWETLGDEAYTVEAPDLTYERSDQDEQITENKLDRADWRSMRSAHHGAGQQRFDVPNSSDPFKFLESKGVDVTVEGEVSLLPATSRILSLANGGTSPQVAVGSESALIVAAGQPSLKALGSATDTSPDTIGTGTETSKECFDLVQDGSYLYAALSSDGVHRAQFGAGTQREEFDSGTWTTTSENGYTGFHYLTTDKQEGTGSLAFDSVPDTSDNTGTFETSFAAVDMSAGTGFTVWAKTYQTTKFRLGTSDSAYYEWTIASTGGSWSKQTLQKADATANGGISSYSAITQIMVNKSASALNWNALTGSGTGTSVVVSAYRSVVAITTGSGTTVTPPAGYTSMGTVTGDLGGKISVFRAASTQAGLTFTLSGSDDYNYIALDSATPTWFSGTVTTSSYTAGAAGTSFDLGALTVSGGVNLVLCFSSEGTEAGTATFEGQSSEIVDVGSGNRAAAFAYIASANFTPTLAYTSSRTLSCAIAIAFPITDAQYVRAQFDDLRELTAGVIGDLTHWSDHDTKVLGTARNTLYGAGISSGTIWRFFEVGATTTSTNLKTLPDGWVVSDIVGHGNFVYFSAYAGALGRVYCYDGTTTFVAWESPYGVQPLSLTSYLGQGLLIGARLSVTGSTSGHGMVYRAQPATSGSLSAVRVDQFGDHDADYGVYTGFALGDGAYYGWNNADASSTGLGVFMPRVDPQSGQQRADYARHLYAATQGLVRSAGVAFGKRFFTVDGSGVWIEQATYLDSGTLTSSDIDWNIDKLKLALQGEVGCEPLSSTETLALAYSTDDGTSYTTLATASGSGTRVATGNIRATLRSARLKATLTANAAATVTPVLKKMGISAIYGVKPRYKHTLVLKAHDKLMLRNKVPHPDSGRPGLALRQWTALKTLRDAQTPVTFNPPGYGYETSSTATVRIGGLKFIESRDKGVRQARIVCELIELPD